MNPDDWARVRVAQLADRYCSGDTSFIQNEIQRLVGRHEVLWKATSAGVFRPTSSMYALALEWELGKRGPTCAICNERIDLTPGQSSGPGSPTLFPRTPLQSGGLNVPQNLALGHQGCGEGI